MRGGFLNHKATTRPAVMRQIWFGTWQQKAVRNRRFGKGWAIEKRWKADVQLIDTMLPPRLKPITNVQLLFIVTPPCRYSNRNGNI